MSSTKPLVLITGANQGLGLDAAKHLAASGTYHVLVTARSLSNAEAAVREVATTAADPSALTPIQLDVTSSASIAAAAELVASEFGHLDILINNAGIGQVPGASVVEAFRQVFDVNVFGVVAVTEAFLPLIKKSTYHDRRIVNVTSALGLITQAGDQEYDFNAEKLYIADYRASKAALNMVTVAMAGSLREEGIAVVAVAPGWCKTRLMGGAGFKEVVDGAKVIAGAATEGKGSEISGKYVAGEAHDGW